MAVKAAGKTAKKKVTKASPVSVASKEFESIAETRYKMAMQVYDMQDSLTKEVLDRIRDRLRIASTGLVSVNGQPHKLEQQYIDFNLMFLATEILGDLALINVRVGNFKPSPMWCAECKQKIAAVPKQGKKK